jgi:hypothetical protein
MATYRTIVPVEIPEIEIRDYTVQYLSEFTGWTDCVRYTGTIQYERQEPATFQDVTEAEALMNKLRDQNPNRTYRMTRKLVITEVVHA